MRTRRHMEKTPEHEIWMREETVASPPTGSEASMASTPMMIISIEIKKAIHIVDHTHAPILANPLLSSSFGFLSMAIAMDEIIIILIPAAGSIMAIAFTFMTTPSIPILVAIIIF